MRGSRRGRTRRGAPALTGALQPADPNCAAITVDALPGGSRRPAGSPFLGVSVEALVREAEAVPPLALGLVERAVGAGKELARFRATAGRNRDADRGARLQLAAADAEARSELPDQPRRKPGGLADLVERRQQDRELVAAEPRDRIGWAETGEHPLGHRLEQGITGRVAPAIVDRFEAVEVDEQDGKQLARALQTGKRALEPVPEQIP